MSDLYEQMVEAGMKALKEAWNDGYRAGILKQNYVTEWQKFISTITDPSSDGSTASTP